MRPTVEPPPPTGRLSALLGLLLLSAASGRECLGDLARYQPLAAPACRLAWHETAGCVIGELSTSTAAGPTPWQRDLVVLEQLAQVATRLRDALGSAAQPLQARFVQPPPADARPCERRLRCACRFGAARDALVYPASLLACPALRADALAHRVLRAACEEQLVRLDAALGVAGQVRRVLARLGDPAAGMAAVAASLAITERTLRRRLAEEGSSFSAIVHQRKLDLATRALLASDAAIDEVAAQAGFSDTANFRRAFIRWTRLSPAQYRRHHRAQGLCSSTSFIH